MNQYTYDSTIKLLTVNDLTAMKRRGEKISCLTAYDASFSALIDKVGVDMMLVGDSLGMVVQGHDTTLPVTINDMIYHTRCVSNARQRSFIIADLPFMSYATPIIAAQNAAKLMQIGGAQMVKLEGPRLEIISFLVDQGIPVCGHLGLLPQLINQLGSYSVQGKTPADAEKIIADAYQLQEAGAGLLVLECVPTALATEISTQLSIPVIGIGAGVNCDGQVLVIHDMLGINKEFKPRFLRQYANLNEIMNGAIKNYISDVKSKDFPNEKEQY